MLLKLHLLHLFGALVLIQYCGEATGNDEDKGRAPLSTMMRPGPKNRKGSGSHHPRPRPRPCKRPPTPPPKKGAANKTDETEQGRFFPGKFGWDTKKFPPHLRPQEPCYEEPEPSDDTIPEERDQTPELHKEALSTWEEERCKSLMERLKNKPKHPKPGEKEYPAKWGWDIGTVVRAKEFSPRKRMRDHNLRYEIHKCKKRQNKNRKNKPVRKWSAPDYAKVAQGMAEKEGGGSDGASGRSGKTKSFQPSDLDPVFNPPGLGASSGFNPSDADSAHVKGKGKGPYLIPSSLPAESFANGGTAHAGEKGIPGSGDQITHGLGRPPLRFLPWAEIFGYRPVRQRQTSSGTKVESSKWHPIL